MKEQYGIKGLNAPAWNIPFWIDEKGRKAHFKLDDFRGKVIYLYCFQSWCPGCHSVGFPTLQALYQYYKADENMAFVAVQSVFEGFEINTSDKLRDVQQKFALPIPFGHDDGSTLNLENAKIMEDYKTGGTPWVIIISPSGKVLFNDFNIAVSEAQKIMEEAKKEKQILFSKPNSGGEVLNKSVAHSTPELELKFPLLFPIKIFVNTLMPEDACRAMIMQVLQKLNIPYHNWQNKISSKGNYQSHSLDLTLADEIQMKRVYADLSALSFVVKVL